MHSLHEFWASYLNIEIKQFIAGTILYFSYFHLVVKRNYIFWIKAGKEKHLYPLFFLMNLAQNKNI